VISASTCAELVRGEHSAKFNRVIIVDCRFDYEYKGGHIRGSINLVSQDDIEKTFFTTPQTLAGDRTAIVFHCEFSKNRGPRTCKYTRERDRQIHGLKFFPKLYYPELYVMEGGYKQFHLQHPDLCEPQGYTSMKDSRFVEIQRVCWKAWKSSKRELSRSLSMNDLEHFSDPLVMGSFTSAKRPLTPSFSSESLTPSRMVFAKLFPFATLEGVPL